jgi:hypothetical protein
MTPMTPTDEATFIALWQACLEIASSAACLGWRGTTDERVMNS